MDPFEIKNRNYIPVDEQEPENENEKFRLSGIRELKRYKNYSNKEPNNLHLKIILIIFIAIIIFSGIFYLSYKIFVMFIEIKESENKDYNYINNLTEVNNVINNIDNKFMNIQKNNKLNELSNNLSKNTKNYKENKKIGLAFLYSTLYGNGIARFITLTANNLMKTGKYDICFITSKPYGTEYEYNSSIKRFIALDNYTLIRNISKNENIDIFIYQNSISLQLKEFYHNLGKKVISIYHGVFMSSMTFSSVKIYNNWINFDSFDAFIFISPDDYFFYKKLGFKNEIFIPNLITFDPLETKSSNLTYNNIIMIGRQNDEYKGAKYAIKTMTYIVKEVPDAQLILVTSDSRVEFLRDLIKELNLTNNVFIHNYSLNISSYFWNSSIHMYTSLSEAYPMAMNEGKAHGLPIVAFDVPYSVPYQEGVIVVDQLDCEALARETIKLLKDYNYRKKMGEYAKRSLDRFTNKEIIELWERLFSSLLNENENEFRNLQFEIEKKYYKEEEARMHFEKSYNSILKSYKNMSCHTLESFTNISYINTIQDCNFSNSNNSIRT